MNVELDEASEQIVRDKMESGQYASAAEVMSEALQALQEREAADREALRRKITLGIEAADRGESTDGKVVIARARERLMQIDEEQ